MPPSSHRPCFAACGSGESAPAAPAFDVPPAGPIGSHHDVRLTAGAGEVEIGPGRVYRTWLYNGQFPGPEIMVRVFRYA